MRHKIRRVLELEPELDEQLTDTCTGLDRTLTWVITQAIKDYITAFYTSRKGARAQLETMLARAKEGK